MRFLVFITLNIAVLADTGSCPYKNTVWSCNSGTRPCVANAVAGWDNLCPATEAECTEHCWSGSSCSECVCQDGLVPNITNTADRLTCMESTEKEPDGNYTMVALLSSYGAIVLVITGFIIKNILYN